MKTFIIAEIGINHNGDINTAKRLIKAAKDAGCDAVKFQKRTIDTVYSKEDLDRPRESPWGTTNREQKNGLEFDKDQYDVIDSYCKELGIEWLASAWDVESQIFLRQFNSTYNKVASAMLTHSKLLEAIAEEGKHTFISTGMSTMEQIAAAIKIFDKAECSYELMHCNSTYPMPPEYANLNTMDTLRNTFNCDVGYSGHETGLMISCAAVAMGANSVERHITLDRSMYGSDQSASLEINGLKKLVEYIREIEIAKGTSEKTITETEINAAKKLRTVDDLLG